MCPPPTFIKFQSASNCKDENVCHVAHRNEQIFPATDVEAVEFCSKVKIKVMVEVHIW